MKSFIRKNSWLPGRLSRCSSEHILDYIELDSEYSIFEVKVPEEWNGKSILELDIRKKYGINILGIRERGILDMNVTPDSVLGKRDSVLVLDSRSPFRNVFIFKDTIGFTWYVKRILQILFPPDIDNYMERLYNMFLYLYIFRRRKTYIMDDSDSDANPKRITNMDLFIHRIERHNPYIDI